jgi:hypothetical protein
MMEDKRAMAAYGGRMQYADGMKGPKYKENNLEDLPEGLKMRYNNLSTRTRRCKI